MDSFQQKIELRKQLMDSLGRKPTNEEWTQALLKSGEAPVKSNTDNSFNFFPEPKARIQVPSNLPAKVLGGEGIEETQRLIDMNKPEAPEVSEAMSIPDVDGNSEVDKLIAMAKADRSAYQAASNPVANPIKLPSSENSSFAKTSTEKDTNTSPASESQMTEQTQLEDEEYNKALEEVERRKNDNMLDAALGQFSTAIANAGTSTTEGISNNFAETNKMLRERENDPINNIKTKREQYEQLLKNKELKDMADPNSDISKAARDLVRDMNMKVDEKATAMQLNKVLPYLQQKFAVEEARKSRALQSQQMAEDKANKRDDKDLDYATRIMSKIDSLDPVKNYHKMATAQARLNEIANLPPNKQNATLQTAALYEYIKLLDPQSVVREGEVKLYGEARNLPETIKAKLQKFSSDKGAVLTPEEMKQISDFANSTVKNQAKAAEMISRNYIQLAKAKGVDKYMELPFSQNSQDLTNTKNPAKTIVKKFYSKSANKTKLVYSDGTEEIVDGQQ